MLKIPNLASVYKISEGFWSKATGKGKGVSKEKLEPDPNVVKAAEKQVTDKQAADKKAPYDIKKMEDDIKEGFRKTGFPMVSKIISPLQGMKESDRKELWSASNKWGMDDITQLVAFSYRWRYGSETHAVYSDNAIPNDDLAYEIFGAAPKPLYRFIAVPDIDEYENLKQTKEIKALGANYAKLPNKSKVNFFPKKGKPISFYKSKEEAMTALDNSKFDKDYTPVGVLLQLAAGNDNPIMIPTSECPSWFGYLYLNLLKANNQSMSDIQKEDEEYVLLLEDAQFVVIKKFDISSGKPEEYRTSDEEELYSKHFPRKKWDDEEPDIPEDEEEVKKVDEPKRKEGPLTAQEYDEIIKNLAPFENPKHSEDMKKRLKDKAWMEYLSKRKKKIERL
jgi:hypothetical protein